MSLQAPITMSVLLHLSFALSALLLGPLVLWAQLGAQKQPKLHRYAGRVWVLCILVTACSALAIRYSPLALWQGYSVLHLLIPATLVSLFFALRAVLRKDFLRHRRAMQRIYIYALVIPGLFALLPNRLLGQMLWAG